MCHGGLNHTAQA